MEDSIILGFIGKTVYMNKDAASVVPFKEAVEWAFNNHRLHLHVFTDNYTLFQQLSS